MDRQSSMQPLSAPPGRATDAGIRHSPPPENAEPICNGLISGKSRQRKSLFDKRSL
jgi:hypothetical protein